MIGMQIDIYPHSYSMIHNINNFIQCTPNASFDTLNKEKTTGRIQFVIQISRYMIVIS